MEQLNEQQVGWPGDARAIGRVQEQAGGRRGKRPDVLGWDDVVLDRPASLIRYALVARIDALCQSLDLTRARVAQQLGMTPPNLHQKLSETGVLRDSGGEFVRSLQWYLQANEERSTSVAGSELVAFRLATLNRVDADPIRLPSPMLRPLLRSGPARSAEEALVRAAGLGGIRSQVDSWADAEQLHRLYNRPLTESSDRPVDEAIEDFVASLALPWGDTNMSRAIGANLQDWVIPTVARHLLESPVGWRASRVLVRMLRLLEQRSRDDSSRLLFDRIETAMRDALERGTPQLDPSRCFYEEALRRSPGGRTRAGLSTWAWEWAVTSLESTARDRSEPFRRRSFAALCLAERAESQELARSLAASFAEEDDAGSHAASILLGFLDGGSTGFGPDVGSDLYAFVREICSDRGAGRGAIETLPPTIQDATRALVVDAVLSIDTSRRRTACDTLVAAGASDEASALIADVVGHDDVPTFVRDIGLAVLGYLGEPNGIEAIAAAAAHGASEAATAALALAEIRSDPHGLAAEALCRLASAKDERLRLCVLYAIAARTVRDGLHDDDRLGHALQIAARGARSQQLRQLAAWATAVREHPHRVVNAISL